MVNNHCHGLYREQRPADALAWRRHFTESYDAALPARHAPHMLAYGRLLRALAGFLGCAAEEDAVLAARAAREEDALIAELLRAARIEALLVDRGFPRAERVRPDGEVAALAGCAVTPSCGSSC